MIAYTIIVISLAFVIYVEGLLNPFWIWNALPLGVTALLLFLARRRGSSEVPALAFGAAAVGIPLYTHLAWLFDWDRTASGSSTSGFIFIFLPIIALVGGAIFWIVARLFVWLRRR